MTKLEMAVSNPANLKYETGWCYHNQLGPLATEAPHILPKKESWPNGVTELREQEITRAGFIPTQEHAASYLYRSHPGPGWDRDGVRALPTEEIAPSWTTGRTTFPPPAEAHMPRAYQPQLSEKKNPIQGLTSLFYNNDLSVGVSSGAEPMPYFLRNADGDDLFFVHEGSGVCETELGVLAYEAGHYFWIPKGIAYRIHPLSAPHELFHIENYSEKFQKPETGFTGDAAVYYHRNIETPTRCFVNQTGKYQVILKANGTFTEYTQNYHPMDVVGWDGDLCPFRLHIRDIQPITSWKSHVPPSAYCTFLSEHFEVCSFVPRPVETGERSLPVPFDHINIDRDEVIFYSRGTFFSKDKSHQGSLTFHPRGPSHGPHRNALQKAWDKREKEGAFTLEGLFLLVETNHPLYIAPRASNWENKDYINSWQ